MLPTSCPPDGPAPPGSAELSRLEGSEPPHWGGVLKSSSLCCPFRPGGLSVPTLAVRSACCSGLTSSQMSSPSRPQTMPGCSCSLPTTGEGWGGTRGRTLPPTVRGSWWGQDA
uniref:Uncharacterized protein n=1 Tax=Ursus maritimus TaxID=29073 RepID=A0A452U391_URSMA